MCYWMLIGPSSNWEISLKHGIWSLPPRHQKSWRTLEAGDIILCYATAPVKGLIAMGTVSETRSDTSLFWPQEIKQNKSLWPLSIVFKNIQALPVASWQSNRVFLGRKKGLQTPIQSLEDDQAKELIRALNKAIGRN